VALTVAGGGIGVAQCDDPQGGVAVRDLAGGNAVSRGGFRQRAEEGPLGPAQGGGGEGVEDGVAHVVAPLT